MTPFRTVVKPFRASSSSSAGSASTVTKLIRGLRDLDVTGHLWFQRSSASCVSCRFVVVDVEPRIL